ncbi:hypothetical protein HYT91_03490 [Candidatus Pacearchaeota archaeon]|nr:hypothetical protein [Candidatus Pacearchaeota archaeon]
MGKLENTLLVFSLIGLGFLGLCNYKKQNTISEQQTKITGLDSALRNYGVKILTLSEKLKDTTAFYSDSLGKIGEVYKQVLLENENSNKKIAELSKKLKNIKFNEGIEKKYKILVNKHDSLEKKFSEIKRVYEKEMSQKIIEREINSYLSDEENKKISFNVKDKSFFSNWKFIPPRLFGIGGESISFKDNDPKDMEAFAKYESGRLIPLKKLDDSDKCSSFHLPYIDFQKGTIIVYAIDKDGNKSKENKIYISGGVISKKKFE